MRDLGKTDAQVAREREQQDKRKNECAGCYWEALTAGCAPNCRRGNQYGTKCREYRQS